MREPGVLAYWIEAVHDVRRGVIFGMWGMMAFNIIANCIGCSISIFAARYHWKRFDVNSVDASKAVPH